MKSYRRMIAVMSVLVAVLLVAAFALLVYMSPGKPLPLTDEDGTVTEGSISEKIFVTVGGAEQGMFIRSRDTTNPVLLFVHGGPCFPNYFLFGKYNPGLEDFFTVCYWEQRGGGLSWSPSMTAESITTVQLADDAIDVANYLRRRFGKDKIFIMAWSGGTTIALPAVSKAPELFHAYIAMGQITRQYESERIAFDYMLMRYSQAGDRKAVRQLRRFRGLETEDDLKNFYNSGIRDNLMHRLGIGTMRNMRSVFRDIFVPVWTCRAYTIREKFNIWRSKLMFLPGTGIKTSTLATDYTEAFPSIGIPVYFVSGRYDLTVNTELSRSYCNTLIAPVKQFHEFENSAHGPLFEEPDRFRELLGEWLLELSLEPTAGENERTR